MTTETTVTLERLIPAPPAVVFAAWLDPQALARFMCPAEGMTIDKVEIDPRVDGRFLIVMRIGGQQRAHHGVYQVIDPPHRLVFSWHSHLAGPESQVTLGFEPAGEATTRLTLQHSGLATEAARQAHRDGWTNILAALATAQLGPNV